MPIAAYAALILAGGAATRMGGGDKPLLQLANASVLQRIVSAVSAHPTAISANGDPTRFASLGLPVLPDGDFAQQGPLSGLLAGLDWAATIGADTLLTVPGDTPFIPHNLAASLAPAPACATSNGRAHHLVALWPTACRAALHHLLATTNRRDVRYFAETIAMRQVDFPVTKWDPFLNINTPDDWAAARAIAEGEQ